MTARFTGVVIALALLFSGEAARAADAAPVAAPGPGASSGSSSTAVSAVTVVDDPAGAKLLFDEAVELGNQGKFVEACEKLDQSRKLHDGIGTSFHLAGCWQKIGRTASAYLLFEQVAKRADAAGQSDRAEVARSRMESLAPKLSRIRIDLAERAPKTEVYRDDVLVPEGDWGKPVPVDRGVHSLRVTAEGKQAWTTQVDVSSPSMVLAVMVPALAKEAPAAAPVVAAAKPKPKPKAEPKPEPKPEPSGSGARTRAVIIGGVGVAALAFGAFEAAKYFESNRDAEDICPSSVNCTEGEIAAHDKAVSDAKQARTWAFVGLGVGGATVALATYLFFSAPHGSPAADEKQSARLSVVPVLDPRGSWGAALNGRF
jgi:hypothetical protein